MGYAVATINGLELHGKGSKRLREKPIAFYGLGHQIFAQFKEEVPSAHLVDDAIAEVSEIRERLGMLETKLRKLKK